MPIHINVVAAARLEAAGPHRDLGGEVFGVDGPCGLRAAWWRGSAVMPFGGEPELWSDLVTYLGQRERGCSSIMGRADVLAALWPALSWHWGPARLVRSVQPLLVTDRRPR